MTCQQSCKQTYGCRRVQRWIQRQTEKDAMQKEVATDGITLHSDQGSQYTSQAYFDLSQKYHFQPSMSRLGRPYDSASMENFFGALKTKCLYRVKFFCRSEVERVIAQYVYFLHFKRINLKDGLTPLKSGAKPCHSERFCVGALFSLSFAGGTVHQFYSTTGGPFFHCPFFMV